MLMPSACYICAQGLRRQHLTHYPQEILREAWNIESIILSCGIYWDIYVACVTGSLTSTDGFSFRVSSGGTQGLLSLLFHDEC